MSFQERLKRYEPEIFKAWQERTIHIEIANQASKHTRVLIYYKRLQEFQAGEFKAVVYLKDHGTYFDAHWTIDPSGWRLYDYRPNSTQWMKDLSACNSSIDQLNVELKKWAGNIDSRRRLMPIKKKQSKNF